MQSRAKGFLFLGNSGCLHTGVDQNKNRRHRSSALHIDYSEKKKTTISRLLSGSKGIRTPDPLLVRQML